MSIKKTIELNFKITSVVPELRLIGLCLYRTSGTRLNSLMHSERERERERASKRCSYSNVRAHRDLKSERHIESFAIIQWLLRANAKFNQSERRERLQTF